MGRKCVKAGAADRVVAKKESVEMGRVLASKYQEDCSTGLFWG
jgi:hypothetical protein